MTHGRSVARIARVAVVASVAWGASGSVFPATWNVRPSISVNDTYTDNVRLAAPGQEQSDLITIVAPTVAVSANRPRLKLNANYSLQQRIYLNTTEANGHSHSLRSHGLLEVMEDHLFVDGTATMGVQNLSLTGAQGTPSVNVTGNTANVRRMTLSPYWVSRLGDWAQLRARYTWDQLASDGGAAALDSQLNGIDVGVTSGRMFSRWQWGLNYRTQKVDYSSGIVPNRESETTSVNLSYAIDHSLRTIFTAGRDYSNFQTSARQNSGPHWSLGLDWRPGPRTNVSGSFGKRHYGETRSLSLAYRAARWSVSGGYSDQVVDTPLRFGIPATADTAATIDRLLISRVPDPLERQEAVEAFILQNGLPTSLDSPLDFVTGQVFVSKRLHFGGGFTGARFSLLGNVFIDRRTNTSAAAFLPGDAFALSNDVNQNGFSLTGSYRLTDATTATMLLGRLELLTVLVILTPAFWRR